MIKRPTTQLVVIAHNIRSCHNVGSILRTSDGLGVENVYLTGYTPYPKYSNDQRLPHEAEKINKKIRKTALGAEKDQSWEYHFEPKTIIKALKQDGYLICALEQDEKSNPLTHFISPSKVAIILGREVEGIEKELLYDCDQILEIPMAGKKESYNVVQAFAMAGYQIIWGNNFVKL